MAQLSSTEVAARLLAQREAFKNFVALRLGDEAEAEDLVQNGLVKVMERAGELKDGEKLTAWFYQLLRRASLDHLRMRQAAARREHAWAEEANILADDAETMGQVCACFERLLPHLKPMQAELIRRVELAGGSVQAAAQALGVTPNHASVTLHRARAELRKKLMSFCGDCRCLADCSCE